MQPTVGIQKDRAKSLPDHPKTKTTDSLKLNKKDLDVVSKRISVIGVSPCFLSEQEILCMVQGNLLLWWIHLSFYR